MTGQKLHIARNGIELGLLSQAEIEDLLRIGFLQPTDECWADLDVRRQLLSTFGIKPPDQGGRWLDWVRVKLLTAGDAVRQQAGGVAAKMTNLAQAPRQVLPQAANRLLDDFAPRLRELTQTQLKGRIVDSTGKALRDEDFLRKLFGAIYDCLPRPIHRFVGEDAFVAYCLRNRRRFLD
jgi:hypothetical protein